MSNSDWDFLECGCTILNGKVGKHCLSHYKDQPVEGDPLWTWLKNRNVKAVPFLFFNDGKKDILVKTTSRSSHENPERIKQKELKTLHIKPRGYMKLWDYEDSYHLLVE